VKLLPFITLFAVLILAACGGGSEATQVPAQTMGITSTQTPLVPSVLLNDIKTAMDALESFTLESELLLKTAKDAETNLISMEIKSAGYVDGNNEISITMDIDTAGFVGKVTNETKTVGGVSYARDSFSAEWSIDEDTVESEDQDFIPVNMVATEAVREVLDGLPVYKVTGTVPDESENELVILWVGVEDFLARQIRQEGKVPASDYDAFQIGNVESLFQSFVSRFRNLNEPVQILKPSVKVESEPGKQYSEFPAMTIDKAATYLATMRTSMGDIRIELFAATAPETVSSFIFLAKEGFYEGVTFHRVIPNFMIQGGDPTGSGSGGAGYSFNDEFDPELKFDRVGVLAMANSGPNTNSSQFFITTVPTPHLNGKHTVFGHVVEGQEIVNAISLVPTEGPDRPIQPVIIQGIDIMRTS